MLIDYQIKDGPQGGLSFEFIPCHHYSCYEGDYDRFGPDVFSIKEEAFLFIEPMIARSFSDWQRNYRHWGVTWVSRETWLEIMSRTEALRRDVRGNARQYEVISKHVSYPGFLPRSFKLHRKALLTFLDLFETRVRSVTERYPYMLISGI